MRLGGWVHRRRDLGGIVFIDLRDRAGIVQVAVGPGAPEEIRRVASGLSSETVVEVEGDVAPRPPNMKNPELATGDVEVHPTKLVVVGLAVTPAIPVARAKGDELPAEEFRSRAPRATSCRRRSCGSSIATSICAVPRCRGT